MQILNKYLNSTIIATAVTLLQTAIPELTPTSLIAAIKAFDADKTSTKDRNKRLYRIKEVCEILNVSRQAVYNLINAQKIVRVKIGSASRITSDSLDRFIEDNSE